MEGTIIELVSIVVLSGLFLLYHGFLFWRIKTRPLTTAAGQNEIIRRAWIKLILEDRKDILAIQALRNVMMSSSLLATTALTLSSLIAAFFIKGEDDTSKITEMISLSGHFTVEHKFFVMILLFMLSFFCYMQSVRLNSHAGMMLSLPLGSNSLQMPEFLTAEYIARVLFRANIYHTAGTRFFYAAFLTILWLFGPYISSVAAAILLVGLYFSDFPTLPEQV